MGEKKGTHGGRRDGAGRHKVIPDGAKRKSIFLTDEEYKLVKAYITKLRE